jgi:peptide/nickel transport system substrate-binding protein
VNFLRGQDAWNPHPAASETLYDSLQRDNFRDVGVVIHPHTGTVIPVRENFVVQTAGPSGKLAVPPTSVLFNVTSMVWEPVGTGIQATSRVVMTPVFGPWHHGVQMNIEDIKAEIAHRWRRGVGDIRNVPLNNSLSTLDKNFLPRFKGFEFTGSTYTVYVDFLHHDTNVIAQKASFWPHVPWEVQALMAKSTLDGDTANNQIDAMIRGVPWLDLTKGPSLPLLDADFAELDAIDAVYPGVTATPTEAAARWTALGAFHAANGHYWPSNGPFYLSAVFPEFGTSTMEAFRNYPLKADRLDHLLVPAIPTINFVTVPTEVIAGNTARLEFTSTVAGANYDRISPRWLFKDPSTGVILGQGVGTRISAGRYSVEIPVSLTTPLKTGSYEVIAVVSSEDASVPSIERRPITVLSLVDYIGRITGQVQSDLSADIDRLTRDNEALRTELATALNNLSARATLFSIVGIIGLLVAAVAVAMALARRGGGPPVHTKKRST